MKVERDESLEEVTCDRCEAPVEPRNIQAGLASCNACGLVFDLVRMPRSESIERLREVVRRPIANRRPPIPLPDGVELEFDEPLPMALPEGGKAMMPYRQAALRLDDERAPRSNARLRMSVPMGTRLGVDAVIALGLLGLIFCVFGYLGIIASPGAAFWLVAALGALLFVGAVWHVLATYMNRVKVTLDGSWLTIAVGPVPFPGNKRIASTNIDQIWTRMTLNRVPGPKKGEYQIVSVYNVEMRRKFGKPIVIVRNLDERSQALYIEQRLEQALGIIDVEVAEESRTDPADA